MPRLLECECGSGEEARWQNDGYGIPLFKACSKCWQRKRSKYRDDIFTCYQTDEPIDED